MSDRRSLCHLLYTNAPGEGGSGLRFLGVGFPGTQAERDRIQAWLMGLQLVGEHQTGWATSSFLVDRSPCFALATVDRTRFRLDEIGRPGGILSHALLLLLEEGKPVGDFGLASFDQARKFLENLPEPPTLDKYLEGCKLATDLEIPDLQYNNFRGVHPRFLETFYSAAYSAASGGSREATVLFPGCTSDDELPEHLLSASSALPPRLRLGLSWRVGLGADGKEGFVARCAPVGSAPLLPANIGTAYLQRVQAQLHAGQDDQVARFAAGDWNVRSWSGLQQAIGQPAPEGDRDIAGSDSMALSEESDMAKKGTATGGKPAAAPREKSQTIYDEQYQALDKDLREYLDEQLTLLGAPPATRSRAPYVPRGSSWGDRNAALRWYREWRPEVYFLILLLGLIAVWQLQPSGKGPTEPTPTPSPSPAPPGTDSTPSPSPPPAADALASWKAFVETPEAAGWFQAVAEARGVAPTQVGGARKTEFSTWTEKLGKEERLTADELTSSLLYFFQYAHARWAKEKGLGDTELDVVTNDPSEVARNLKKMVEDLGLTGALGSDPAVGDAKVQAEVTLAWIKRTPPEPWRQPSP